MAQLSASTGLARRAAPALVSASAPVHALKADCVPFARMGSGDVARWKDLAANAAEPNVFLEPPFACAAAFRFGGADLLALRVKAGERLVGFLPGRVEGVAAGRPFRTFVAWTHPFAPLCTPLVHRDLAAKAIAALLDAIPELPDAPRLALFPRLAETGAVARQIALHAKRSGSSPVRFDVHVRAALVPNTPLPTKRRKELARQRRRLGEQGSLERRIATGGNAVAAAVDEYLRLEASGWKGRVGGAAMLEPATRRFFTEAVAALAREGKARIDLLTLDGRAIAATVVLRSGNRAWFWKTAYDERYAAYSPGVLLALDLTDALQAERGIALVDSCAVADHPMIDRLWSERLPMADWLVPLRRRAPGAVAAETVRRTAMRLVKSLRDRIGPR